ncbi:cupin domain-containing protein [Algoriphagus sp. CAU 1675]|uniref:(R)-mandelonitrile lyase n=1 Tax=Algoriphagus sp. CAU 1675 TaxID=3032597 RepID=UPI0023DB32E0|nr:cupin domain-containing protein [Algoriphagus sp. CAU 1675]MDF2157241.1 cupin domain-containing protein [Algoriphagus sp. CAU 1675]
MEIKKNGTHGFYKGPEDWFTGQVRIQPLFSKQPKTLAAGALVTFEAGARTAWHTHPAGQTLIVQSGLGLVQKEGGPIVEIGPGDVVYFEPEEKHWHGASPKSPMSHIAIQEEVDGKVVTWMEKVTDEDYERK